MAPTNTTITAFTGEKAAIANTSRVVPPPAGTRGTQERQPTKSPSPRNWAEMNQTILPTPSHAGGRPDPLEGPAQGKDSCMSQPFLCRAGRLIRGEGPAQRVKEVVGLRGLRVVVGLDLVFQLLQFAGNGGVPFVLAGLRFGQAVRRHLLHSFGVAGPPELYHGTPCIGNGREPQMSPHAGLGFLRVPAGRPFAERSVPPLSPHIHSQSVIGLRDLLP